MNHYPSRLQESLRLVGFLAATVVVAAQSSDRSFSNKLENRVTTDFRENESVPKIERGYRLRTFGITAPGAEKEKPAWEVEQAFIVQPSYSSNPENVLGGNGAWFSRQDYSLVVRRKAASTTASFAFETDSAVYEGPAKDNNEVDPSAALALKIKSGTSGFWRFKLSDDCAIIDGRTVLNIPAATAAYDWSLTDDAGTTLSTAVRLERRDYRPPALAGLQATRITPSLILNHKFAGGAVAHVGAARLDNAAQAAAADSETRRVLGSVEALPLIKDRLTLTVALRHDARRYRQVGAPGFARRDNVTVLESELTYVLSPKFGLVGNWNYTRQKSNSPGSVFTERVFRLGLGSSF